MGFGSMIKELQAGHLLQQLCKDTADASLLQPGWVNGFGEIILAELWDEVEKAWNSLLAELSDELEAKKYVVVVGHPVVHVAQIGHCLNLSKECMESFQLDAGSISVIDFPEEPTGRGVIRCINYTAHLGRWSIPVTRPSVDDESFLYKSKAFV